MSLPNRTLRLLWICALWCCSACTVDVSIAPGKACDADHPCSADRVCSADGICVVPSEAEVTDGGDDGGQDAGVIAPEEDGGVDDPTDAGGELPDGGSCESDPRFGQPCEAGVGACAQAGQFVCRDGAIACDAVPAQGGPEVCDGVDNDCDGTVDEVSKCLYTLSGTNSAAGFRDGVGDAARFSFPRALAADAAGNLYVADSGNHAIRKIDTTGAVTTLAGSGICGDRIGPAAQSELCDPQGVAVNAAGTLVYFSETSKDRIRKIENGTVSEVAGTGAAGFVDGAATTARFDSPVGLFLEPNGDLLIADASNQRIRRYVAATQRVVTVAGSGASGNKNGTSFTTCEFNAPVAVVEDSQGNLYVSEHWGERIRKLSSNGSTVSVLAGSSSGIEGYSEGIGTAAEFTSPNQLTLDEAGGYLYVTDSDNNRVRAVPLSGSTSTVLVAGGPGGGSSLGRSTARFVSPMGLVFSGGALYVGDYTHAIKKISLSAPALIDTVTDLAGSSVPKQSDNGSLATARMGFPLHFSVDPEGGVLFVEDHTNLVRRWSPDGTISTLAGDAVQFTAGNVNGSTSTSAFDAPTDVQIGPDGRLYVAEKRNNDLRVIDLDAGTVSLFAGSPSAGSGSANGSLLAARFREPTALAWWKDGQSHDILFVGDQGNRVIRKIDVTTGTVSTFAGTVGSFGGADGPPGTGKFRYIFDLVVDPATGNLYVADSNAARKVDPSGTVTTLATSFPDDLLGVDLDGPDTVVLVGGRRVWQVDVSSGSKSVYYGQLRLGVQDGDKDDSAAGQFSDVKVYPDHYLLVDYLGRRFRQLWK